MASRDYMAMALFVVVTGVLTFLIGLLAFSIYFQATNYTTAVAQEMGRASPDPSSVITYLRAWDFAVVKISGLFLAFALIFLGTLYVLRTGGVQYGLAAESPGLKATLETTSPGLVMVTLGVFLVVFVVYARSTVEYTAPSALSDSLPIIEESGAVAPEPSTPLEPKP